MNTNRLIDGLLIGGGVTTDIERFSRKDTKSYQGNKVAKAYGRRFSLELFAKSAAGQVILPANLRSCLFDIGFDLVKKTV